MKVVERFISINGEGRRAGELSVFIRFKDCNLSCSYCDTKWANDPNCPYEELSACDILSFVLESGVSNVTLTGGEPLLQKDMPLLLRLLGERPEINTEVETNGSVDLSLYAGAHRPVFTMDYKLPSSGMESRMLISNLKVLSIDDSVKFVVGQTEDLRRAHDVIEKFDLVGKCQVYLSPVFGSIEPSDIVEYMSAHRMNGVRLQLQMHKCVWPPDKRGV